MFSLSTLQIFLNFPKKQFAKISVYLISTVAKFKHRLNWIFCFWFKNNVIFSSCHFSFYSVDFQFNHLQGRIQEFFRGGLQFFFPGGSAPLGLENPLQYHWSRGGLASKTLPWLCIWPSLRGGGCSMFIYLISVFFHL